MLFLIPLGADSTESRLPRATLGLLALNLAAFLLTTGSETSRATAQLDEIARVAEYSLRGLPLAARRRAEAYSSPLAFVEQDTRWLSEATDQDRERLLACRQDYLRLKAAHPFYRFGFVPAEPSLFRLLSHQFLHADFLHLLFNMLFLWTVGGLLEATLHTAAFALCYLLSGVAAALAHAAAHAGSAEPAIGASGAVAGIMGTCAVLHFRERMRVALVAGLGIAPRISLVSLPVGVVLGLWLLEQAFMASFRSSSLNVAFEAHLGGFAFGAACGAGIRLWRSHRRPLRTLRSQPSTHPALRSHPPASRSAPRPQGGVRRC